MAQPDFAHLSLDLNSLLPENDLCFAFASSLTPPLLLTSAPSIADSLFSADAVTSAPILIKSHTASSAPSDTSTITTTQSLAHLQSPLTKNSSSPALSLSPSRSPLLHSKSRSVRSAASHSSKSTKPLSPLDKIAERRRKNRESSSRCYYNRKRIIQNLEKQLCAEKQKLTHLYDTALQLRHDNAKLKKEVVTNGFALPCSRSTRSHNSSRAFSIRDYLRLLHHATYNNPAQM